MCSDLIHSCSTSEASDSDDGASSSANSSTISSAESMKEIKDNICTYLDAVSDGTFATSGILPNAVNPGLSIKGLGKVGLPLSERDAQAIIKQSREAPFGKGSRTFVDQSVRKTWELDPQQVQFRNREWPEVVQDAVRKSMELLGVIGGETSVRADLHKLLLYEKDGFFKTHKDTEKAPGMFATLVIMLPSEHDGGDVVVHLRDRKQTLSTSASKEFGYSYMAWYADVNHSIQPVTSGYRLVLTYNLIHRSNTLEASRPASVLNDNQMIINQALKAWNKNFNDDVPDSDSEFIYPLDHEYSEANYGLRFMKGADQNRCIKLHEACQEHGFCMFLAHFEHTSHGDRYDESDDAEKTWTLKKLFLTEGILVAEDIEVEKNNIAGVDDILEAEPDDEEFEGWLGNEEAESTQIYRRSCLVILHRDQLTTFLGPAGELQRGDWTEALLHRIESNNNAEAAKDELLKLCSIAVGK